MKKKNFRFAFPEEISTDLYPLGLRDHISQEEFIDILCYWKRQVDLANSYLDIYLYMILFLFFILTIVGIITAVTSYFVKGIASTIIFSIFLIATGHFVVIGFMGIILSIGIYFIVGWKLKKYFSELNEKFSERGVKFIRENGLIIQILEKEEKKEEEKEEEKEPLYPQISTEEVADIIIPQVEKQASPSQELVQE